MSSIPEATATFRHRHLIVDVDKPMVMQISVLSRCKSLACQAGDWQVQSTGHATTRQELHRLYSHWKRHLRFVRFLDDFPVMPLTNVWMDTMAKPVVDAEDLCRSNTHNESFERCILMATDPGDLVLDPTCGSGTTAYVAEQWGRRWITIDTSRVALAWPVPASWVRAIRITCWPIAAKARSRRPKSPAPRPSRSPPAATSARASSMSACRTSRSSPSPTTRRSMSSGTSGRRSWSRCASR